MRNVQTRRKSTFRMLCMSLITLVAAVGLTACTSNSQSDSEKSSSTISTTTSSKAAASSDNGKIEAAPKVAAVSLDTADAVLEIVPPEHVVAVPKSMANPYLAVNEEKGKQVSGQVGGATGLDPEGILAFHPDVVLITKIHNSENDAEQLLSQAGVKVVTFDQWGTFEQLIANFRAIGEAVGAVDKAEEVAKEIQGKLDDAAKRTASLASKPSVLVLSPVGPNTGPYIMGPGNISYDMIRLSGAKPAAEALGIKKSTKASIEDVINMNPDYIVLGDWDGTGDEWLKDLKSQAAWNTLDAVKNNRITTMKAKELLAPNRYTVDGMLEMSAWLHPDLWKGDAAN
ncbi:Fe3+-hydroxamate ABC transporter substrate-binding protein [Paenibacillus sp. E194]|uniref:ABC transporter substrate-binding protein n=1 Tax=Paenibacillus sp. E194 TaxID=1458845 RepID=UPI0005C98C38|nr:ABC transporter substrate-binding protein [Paenibacillus sp. E194]KJB89239.1 Fe3+-hydroxamate ABC transporter substrate-binding protein [Paenibacillus sp. E194]